jgi:hypothetical protein
VLFDEGNEMNAVKMAAATIAIVGIVGLLAAFHHVVRGAVLQSELRRQAIATHAEAVWRCNALRVRDSCLAQLNAAPHDDATLQGRNIATVAPIAEMSR